MSGTYQIDGDLLLDNPLRKQWSRQNIGYDSKGKPIQSQYWNLDLTFGMLRAGSGTASNQLMAKRLEGGLHAAVLPHPLNGVLTRFSGVTIENVSFSFIDRDQDRWAGNARVQLGYIDLDVSWDY